MEINKDLVGSDAAPAPAPAAEEKPAEAAEEKPAEAAGSLGFGF